MTGKQKILYVFMLMPLVSVIVALFFLPARFPARVDSQGAITAWYSKFILLAVPAFSVLMGLFTMKMEKRALLKGAQGVKLALLAYSSGMLALFVFFLVTVYTIYAAFVLKAFIP